MEEFNSELRWRGMDLRRVIVVVVGFCSFLCDGGCCCSLWMLVLVLVLAVMMLLLYLSFLQISFSSRLVFDGSDNRRRESSRELLAKEASRVDELLLL